jgi:hypothetical protein
MGALLQIARIHAVLEIVDELPPFPCRSELAPMPPKPKVIEMKKRPREIAPLPPAA